MGLSLPAVVECFVEPEELLRQIYALERPLLQRNNWDGLRLPVVRIVEACDGLASEPDVVAALRALRQRGQIMLFPDWQRWVPEEDANDGEVVPSTAQWEYVDCADGHPTWRPRPVFLPDEFDKWFVRSRIAETTRLLAANRERFGLEAATAHVGYELQSRLRPRRNATRVADVADRLCELVDAGHFPRASNRDACKQAIRVVAGKLGHSHLADFQARAWETVLASIFGCETDGTMLTAGVSSGKTLGFLLPLLTLLVYRRFVESGQSRRVRGLIIYPRTSLVEDQYHGLCRILERINAQLGPAHKLAEYPALDAGQKLGQSLGQNGSSLAEVLPLVASLGVQLVLTTPESLKNRMLDPRAVRTYLAHVEVIVFDEIHLMEGLSGCHGIYFVRRLRQLIRDLRGDQGFEPAWVGASATVAEPVKHASKVFRLPEERIVHVTPNKSELEQFGTFHHLFLHTRTGKPSISAVTNGVSCLVHTRNDSTAHAHYVDPSAQPRQPRACADVQKTLVFVDSLSTIGRLKFTTADNERTFQPHRSAPPYYSWFYRPAARLRATGNEIRTIGHDELRQVREWCERCYHGIPARIDSRHLKAETFTFLRTHRKMDAGAIARATPPGFPEVLQRLDESVENLDGCPFHKERLCWWFSQDPGVEVRIGNGTIPIDQNRAVAYTSKTVDASAKLHDDVDEYFQVRARALWTRAEDIPARTEVVSTMLASPRIEVGVDFSRVRDGATHKAMRSAASFQQKIGRVGREHNSDSIIVTFLAHRPTDAYFAHRPARLLNPAHLEPIPLKAENPDVQRNHLFAAALEYIATRNGKVIADNGHELNIIGTGSNRSSSWERKVRGCIQFLDKERARITAYMCLAVGLPGGRVMAAEVLDALREILYIFVVDLSGAYPAGGTAAHWIKANDGPSPSIKFVELMERLDSLPVLLNELGSLPARIQAATNGLRAAMKAPMPRSADVRQGTGDVMNAVSAAMAEELPPDKMQTLLRIATQGNRIADALDELSFRASLPELRTAFEVMQAFFSQRSPDQRQREQYYLHDVLTRLTPFRKFYPCGLVRSHFQHINSRHVVVNQPGSVDTTGYDGSESLLVALHELLPGTWNYRWVEARKSQCGAIDREGGTGINFINLSNIEGPSGAAFQETDASLSPRELPDDMPTIEPGTRVPILRPLRLSMSRCRNQPRVRNDTGLVADGDESDLPTNADESDYSTCPTLPRSFPATWYRVRPDDQATAVVGRAVPHASGADSLPHTLPATGRVLFQRITESARLRMDRYIYALDRTYGLGSVDSPRLHYRRGVSRRPVVLGDTLRHTDGLTFELDPAMLDTVLDQALGQPGPLRGEVTARAFRQFVARVAGCGPFESDMIRKVVLAAHLQQAGTLTSLDGPRVQRVLTELNENRYAGLSELLIDGIHAGMESNKAVRGRERHRAWYDGAWTVLRAVRNRAGAFDDAFIHHGARNLLVHSLAVVSLSALRALVGASGSDLGYFHDTASARYYLFDTVEGGNGYSETIARFLQIPPLRRLLEHRRGGSALPDADGFTLFEEALAGCPAQLATRLLFESWRLGVPGPANLRFPNWPVADLEARIRHEFDGVAGAHAIGAYLLHDRPGLFTGWQDLIWLQLVPEFFAADLVANDICQSLASLRTRTHLCVTGCLECVDNGDGSVYGSLTSREYVSRTLLDLVRQHIVAKEPASFANIPANTTIGEGILGRVGRPVLDDTGAPVMANIPDSGGLRQVSLTQVLSRVAPAPGLDRVPLLTPTEADEQWVVRVPFLAGYRDERPIG